MELTKRLNLVVKCFLGMVLFSIPPHIHAQELSLFQCHEKAEALSPLQQKEAYISSMDALKAQARASRNLPTISIQGSASYQSDVFTLPFELPNVETPTIPKAQYNLSLNLNQKIYDGGRLRAQAMVDDAETKLNQAQLKSSLFPIKKVINELYAGIVTIQENGKILQNLLEELANQVKRAESGYKNGIVLKSDIQTLQKEQLKVRQQLAALGIQKESLTDVLETWLGEEIETSTEFSLPEVELAQLPLNRPESKNFLYQKEGLLAREAQSTASTKPVLGGFARAGIGSPNPFNFFETGTNGIYIVGLNLSWTPWDWKQSKKQRSILQYQQKMIQAEEDNFFQQIEREQRQLLAKVTELEQMLELDQEILSLQTEITQAQSLQFEQGVLSSADYISALNEKTRAELDIQVHNIQLTKAKLDVLTLTGNLP